MMSQYSTITSNYYESIYGHIIFGKEIKMAADIAQADA